jgi:hypothetical protein
VFVSVFLRLTVFFQHFGSVLNGIIDVSEEQQQHQRHQDQAVLVDGVAALDICEAGDGSAPAAGSSTVASAAQIACNIVSLLQSLHETMAAVPDGSNVCAEFTSSFLFRCMLRINWLSSSSSSSPPSTACQSFLSHSPGPCAIVAAARPLLQVNTRPLSLYPDLTSNAPLSSLVCWLASTVLPLQLAHARPV